MVRGYFAGLHYLMHHCAAAVPCPWLHHVQPFRALYPSVQQGVRTLWRRTACARRNTVPTRRRTKTIVNRINKWAFHVERTGQFKHSTCSQAQGRTGGVATGASSLSECAHSRGKCRGLQTLPVCLRGLEPTSTLSSEIHSAMADALLDTYKEQHIRIQMSWACTLAGKKKWHKEEVRWLKQHS